MNGFAVATIFSAVDKFSPVLGRAQYNVNKFSLVTKAALRSIIPEASRLNDVIKGVAIGNLISKGITGAVNLVRNNFRSAVNYASDLIEVQNVVDTVFGNSAKSINTFAKSAGDSFGLTELQAKNFSSTIGAMFSGMGVKGNTLHAMSTGIAGLAGDLASFHNLDIDDAFNKLRSGMSGQTEPLMSLGINMNVKNMEEFAKTKGIKTAWKDMNQLNQTMLRYQFIMERTKLAQGDYQKPIESWAVSSRNLTNRIGEMWGKLAQGLIPALIKGADKMTGIVRSVSEWADANRELIATRAEEFITKTIEVAEKLFHIIKDYGPAILAGVAAVEAFSVASKIYEGVTIAVEAYNAVVKAQELATAGATIAQNGLNVAMKANLIGLIAAGVVLLIGLFLALANKVGGVKNAFIVLGQTSMKIFLTPTNLVIDLIQLVMTLAAKVSWVAQILVFLGEAFKVVGNTVRKFLLTPINFVIEGIKKILQLVSLIPGKAGEFGKSGLEVVNNFQNGMNTTLTGSESTLFNAGPAAFLDPAKTFATEIPDKLQNARGVLTQNVAGIQSFQDKMNTTLTGSTSTLVSDGPMFITEPYRNARQAELARQETARQTAKVGAAMESTEHTDDKAQERLALQQATLDELKKLNGKAEEQIEATNGLADNGSSTSPARLRWGAMGAEDFYEIQRLGT